MMPLPTNSPGLEHQLVFNLPPYNLRVRGQANSPLDAGKPLLICLHGWLDNSASFAPLAGYLQDYTLLALDLPGHGHSDHAGDGASYQFVEWVVFVHELLEQQIAQPYFLVSHSMGACISTLVAGLRPRGLQGLVLIDGVTPYCQPDEAICEQVAKHIAARRKYVPGKARVFDEVAVAVASRLADSDLDHRSAQLIVERNLEETTAGYRWRFDPRLRWPSSHRLTDKQVLSFCHQINVPSMLIAAPDSSLPVHKFCGDKIAAIPNLQQRHIAGGHHLHMLHPDVVSEAIKAFLRPYHD